jgi:NAD(P)-dependent dehydrogenase (short-subunit alcohol dehydrogenase family)
VAHDRPFTDRTALVTGSSRGIGGAIALALARAGAEVALTARDEAGLGAVAATIMGAGGRAHVLPADLLDDAAVLELAERARAVLGHVDVVVHNAGGGPPHADFARTPRAGWDTVLRLNLRAPMLLTQMLLPDVLKSAAGALIFISSIAGTMGSAGAAAYSAAKFGIRGFAQSVFEEVREHGVRVAVICPGFVDTAMIPPNRKVDRARMLRPEDVADAVIFALSSSSTAAVAEITLRPQRSPYRR